MQVKPLTINNVTDVSRFFAVFGGMEGPWKGLIPFKLWVEALMNPQNQLHVATRCRCVASRKAQ
jgi:hypothetical protein